MSPCGLIILVTTQKCEMGRGQYWRELRSPHWKLEAGGARESNKISHFGTCLTLHSTNATCKISHLIKFNYFYDS